MFDFFCVSQKHFFCKRFIVVIWNSLGMFGVYNGIIQFIIISFGWIILFFGIKSEESENWINYQRRQLNRILLWRTEIKIRKEKSWFILLIQIEDTFSSNIMVFIHNSVIRNQVKQQKITFLRKSFAYSQCYFKWHFETASNQH